MLKRVTFQSGWLPFALVAPQILITLLFFIFPAVQAIEQSFFREDPFGLRSTFVWLRNYDVLFNDAAYYHSLWVTAVFSFCVTALSMGLALLFAVMADRVVRGALAYRTLLIAPYAIAPVIAGVVWLFVFQPTVGILAYVLQQIGIDWNFRLNGDQAMLLVVIAAAWKQIAYNFLFFLAGLQAIPRSLIEAAAIDGAGPAKRFWTIVFPLLSPTTFFLLVVNVVYAFFDTFAVIDAVTSGGPGSPGATNTLVYKVFNDGFVGLDLGGSSAQSVVLMIIVIGLTVVQFRYIEKKVHY